MKMERMVEARRWFSEAEWDMDIAKILHDYKKFNVYPFIQSNQQRNSSSS